MEMADMEKIKQLLADGEKLGAVKKAVVKLSALLDRLGEAQKELTTLLGGGTAKPKAKAAKPDHPKPGSAPAKLCKVMGATPKTAAVIAKAVGIKEATAKIYFGKFTCFSNVRKKGYIYTKPATKKKTTKKKP